MSANDQKIQRLIDIARAYYEDDGTQEEVARRFGVSRPLVSRLLREARELGIVKIEIQSPLEWSDALLRQLRETYAIRGGVIVPGAANDNLTNEAVAEAAIEHLRSIKADRYGIGWGTIIGILASLMDARPPVPGLATSVCPLIGNSGVSNRNYHSNEIVRIFARQTSAQPLYWHAPAFVESDVEARQIKELENSKAILAAWEALDVAIVNIGNYPSVPDLATQARYQDKLTKRRAVGRLLSYYFDIKGEIIRSDTDFTLQIPLEVLAGCSRVVGVCAANVTGAALAGALRSGFITHVIASKQVAQAALEHAG